MIRPFKKYFAIRSYVKRLSQDLARRFKRRPFYSIQNVTDAAQRGKFSMEFIAYAHAAYCSFESFDAHYRPLGSSYHYQDLRRAIARRYLSGQSDFDAETIIVKYQSGDSSPTGFYESGLGGGGG
jgi:hypothetical protein